MQSPRQTEMRVGLLHDRKTVVAEFAAPDLARTACYGAYLPALNGPFTRLNGGPVS